MKRELTQQIRQIQRSVSKVNSLVKLPKLSQKQSSLLKIIEAKNDAQTSLAQKITNNIDWRQRLLSRKLAPLSSQLKPKPQSSFVHKKSSVSLRNIEPRIASSKTQLNNLITGKAKSISSKNLYINQNYQQQTVPINSVIESVEKAFSHFISKQMIRQLYFPNLIAVKIEEFHPYWEMVDTILLTFQKTYFTNIPLLKSICLVYTYVTVELTQVRQRFYSDVQKFSKKELLQVLCQCFALQVHFIYAILAVILMKQTTPVLSQFLFSKIQPLVRMRKLLIETFLCDPNKKQQIKANNKIIKFIPLKQKMLNQLQKSTLKLINQSFKALSQLDDKFMLLNVTGVQTPQQLDSYEQKLKKQILKIPTKPYLTYQSDKEYNLVIEVENFLFKQDKKFSTLLLRQDSIQFLKTMETHCNIIIYSRLPHSQLKPFLKHLEDHNIKLDGVLDKKHLTYNNFRQVKDLGKVGVNNLDTKTIVIDPNYRNTIDKEYWHLCLPINKDGAWNDDTFIKRLVHRLHQIIIVHQEIEMTQFEL